MNEWQKKKLLWPGWSSLLHTRQHRLKSGLLPFNMTSISLSSQKIPSNVYLENKILCCLLTAGGDGRFEVDRKSGHVRTTGLPLQRDKEYLLTVVAADRLGSRSPPVVVSVIAGARAPQFSNASFTISLPENTPERQPWVPHRHTHTHICSHTYTHAKQRRLVGFSYRRTGSF